MKKIKKCHGVVIPLVTPYLQNGSIDALSLKALINFVVAADTFPFILGTTGESLSMPVAQRAELVEKTVGFLEKRATLYVGISDNSVSNTLWMANEFKNLGADIFVVHLPSYYPLNDNQIYNFFEKLADNSPAPIMIYNIPATTNVSISFEIIEKLCSHPNIWGLKDSERSLERIKILAESFSEREDFTIMSGWTAQSAHTLLSGFDGIVPSTGNVIPAMFKKMYDAVITGDEKAAQQIQTEVNPLADLHQKDRILSEVIPALKIMMNEKGLCNTNVLWPLTDLSETDEKTIRQNFNSILKQGSIISQA